MGALGVVICPRAGAGAGAALDAPGAVTLAALLDAVVTAAAADQRTQPLLTPDAVATLVHSVLEVYVPDPHSNVETPFSSSSAAAAADIPLQLLEIDCRLPPPLRNSTLRALVLDRPLRTLRTCAGAGARDERAKAAHYDAQVHPIYYACNG